MNCEVGAYFEISPVHKPPKKSQKQKEEEVPLLRLIQFTHSPKVSFENVKLGATKLTKLHILNPKDQTQEVFCEKYPCEEDGFIISPMRATVMPGETIEVILSWTPKAEGNIRELIHWKTSIGVRSQTVLLGTCVNPNPKSRKRNGVKGFTANPLKQPLRPHNQQTSANRTKPKSISVEKPMQSATCKVLPKKSVVQISQAPKIPEICAESNQENRCRSSATYKPEAKKKSRKGNKENFFVTFSEDTKKPEGVLAKEYTLLQERQERKYEKATWKSTALHSQTSQRDLIGAKMEETQNLEDQLSFNPIPPSPCRRQTYIKPADTKSTKGFDSDITQVLTNFSESESYSTSKTWSLHDLDSTSTDRAPEAARREPLIVSSEMVEEGTGADLGLCSRQEKFGDARKGLLHCDVLESPLRRQTYIKKSWDQVEQVEMIVERLEEVESVETDSLLDLTISTPSTISPSDGINKGKKESSATANLDNTFRRHNSNIRQSCMHLLEKLDCMFGSPQIPNSSFEGTRSLPLKTQKENSDAKSSKTYFNSVPLSLNVATQSQHSSQSEVDWSSSTLDVMHTAPCSPAEFVTAPSTPADYDHTLIYDTHVENDHNNTQDFPTPKICALKSLDLTNLSALLEAQGLVASDSNKSLSPSLSTDTLDKSSGENGHSVISPILSDDDKSKGEDNVDLYPHQRLSNGTVVLETSILHPDDLVQINDSSPTESVDLVKDTRNDDVFLPPPPVKACTEKERCRVEPRCSTVQPAITHPDEGFASESVNITPDRFWKGPRHSETLASLDDFSLSTYDPQRCSTLVKSPPGSTNLPLNDVGSKKKLFSISTPPTSKQKSPPDAGEMATLRDSFTSQEQGLKSCTFTFERSGESLPTDPVASEVEESKGLTFIEISPPTIKPGRVRSTAAKVWPRAARAKRFDAYQRGASSGKRNLPRASLVLHSATRNKSPGEGDSLAPEKPAKLVDESCASAASSSKLNSSSSVLNASARQSKLRKSRQFLSQSRLMLTQKTLKAHHPNPFAARNMYYDDRWVEKEIAGFTKWLNFVLTPPDEENQPNKKVDVTKLWMEASRCSSMQKAPSREAMSLKTYTARRRLGKLRRAACRLYQSPEVARVITQIERAIEKKLITIRKDRQTHADLGLKQEMLKLTLCFNPLWLRVGLETVYGEVIFLNSNSDIAGLTLFIITRLLNCPDIADKYAHPTVPFSYKRGFEDALKTFQLKKFLMLVYFLDRAKQARLIDHDPCLFNKESGIKSTREVLLAFAREFLSGVGDITKHLSYLGYNINHQQNPLDEFDYAVSNLMTDLRCGIRLTRVVETLLQDFGLSRHLRMPAVSRLQKIHNTELALKALLQSGGLVQSSDYTAKDIVDGHQEKTLSLLWDVIFTLQIKNILSVSRLAEEIYYLRKTLLVKGTTDARAKKGTLYIKSLPQEMEEVDKTSHTSELSVQLLKLWARLVCAHYGLEVENLTVSFCDGRAFCLILHHYHADILKQEMIKMETTQNLPSPSLNLDASSDDSFTAEPYYDNEEIEQRMLNDKANFSLFIAKLNELGGVPVLIRPSDMINTIPDERVTTTFLAYLCARLLDLSAEIKAARIIQLAWRKRMARIRLERIKRETEAALEIQTWWRRRLTKRYAALCTRAAVVLQAHWRRRKAMRRLRELRLERDRRVKENSAKIIQRTVRRFLRGRRLVRTEAVISIQKTWRMWRQRRHFLQLRSATLKIQSNFRRCRAEKDLRAKRSASVRIQAWWRRVLQRRREEAVLRFRNERAAKIQMWWKAARERRRFLQVRHSVVLLQSHFRRAKEQTRFRQRYRAVVTLQRAAKAWLDGKRDRREYLRMRRAAIKIQATWRGRMQRTAFQRAAQSALVIQRNFRMRKARRKYEEVRSAVVCIQRRWKACCDARKQRERYLIMKRSAILIQSHFRMSSARKLYASNYKKIVCVQSLVRGRLHRNHFKRQRNAALVIQRRFRGWKSMREERVSFLTLKSAAVTLQAHCKGYRCRKIYKGKLEACRTIQRYWRAYSTRQEFLRKKRAALTLSAFVTSSLKTIKARRDFLKKKQAALCIQKHWRAFQDCRKNRKREKAALILQAFVRGCTARKNYQALRKSCIFVQKNARMQLAAKAFRKKKSAAIKIQRFYRRWKRTQEEKAKITAAVRIQSWWRMHRQRQKFLAISGAVRVLQTRLRASLIASETRRDFCRQKEACIVLQSYCRMIVARRQYRRRKEAARKIQTWFVSAVKARRAVFEYERMRTSALIVQTCFRMWRERRDFQSKKRAAKVIQSRFRAFLVMKTEREEFERKKRAARIIQSRYRCLVLRETYKRQRAACITIQSWFRKISDQRRYQRMKSAASVLQEHVRRYLTRKERERKDKAAIILQKNFKRFLARKHYCAKRRAALVLQKYGRSWIAQKRYRKLRNASSTIQRYFRSYLETKSTRFLYLRQREAVLVLQKHTRRFLATKNYQKTRASVVRIQTTWKSYSARRQFLRHKKATHCIQMWYRNCKTVRRCRWEFERMRIAAICIQAVFRGHVTRQLFKKQNAAAVKIQSCFRGYVAKKRLMHLRRQVIKIQKRYRCYREARLIREEFVSQKKACVTIQRSFRAVFERRTSAATKIQCWWRMLRLRRKYLLERRASSVIKTHYRNYKQTKRLRTRFLDMKAAAICVQRCFRGYKIRQQMARQHRSAVIIQATFRSYLARKNYRHATRSIRVIQNFYRGYLLTKESRQRFLAIRKSVILIQRYARGNRVRTSVKTENKAAVRIQSTYRMWVAKKRFTEERLAVGVLQNWWRRTQRMKEERRIFRVKRGAALLIQALWKGRNGRQQLARQTLAAVRIQSAYRGWRARRRYQLEQRSVLLIQKWWANRSASARLRKEFVAKREAARVIQKRVRSWLGERRGRRENEAATTIQVNWKMAHRRTDFLKKKDSALRIQRWWRSHLETKRVRCNYLYLQGCILVMQARSRGLLARKRFARLKSQRDQRIAARTEAAAVCIQRSWRCWAARAEYRRKRDAVLKLQRYWRGTLMMLIAREYFIYLRRASVILQSAWRARVARRKYQKILGAAFIIQRAYREWSLQRREKALEHLATQIKRNWSAIKIQRWYRRRQYYTQRMDSVVLIQRSIKTFLCRKKFLRIRESAVIIQRFYRQVNDKRKQERRRLAATTIQRYWRGYATRNALRFNRRVTQIRGRLIEANAQACESNMIGNRTDHAITTLILYKDAKRILIAVMSLDYSTRWSAVCCEKVLLSKDTLTVLLFLLRRCNRSLPHMDILTHVLNTLINLFKFDSCQYIIENFPELIDSILHLMKIYHDKGPIIFLKSCSLLYIMASANPFPKELSSPNVMEVLVSLCNVLKRKQTLQSKGKGKTNADPKCPSLTPEWAMKPTEVREFSNPISGVFALKNKIESRKKEKYVSFKPE